MQWGIVADDLTGAADVALPFALRGATTVVALMPTKLSAADVDVIAVDADARWRTRSQAAQRIAQCVRQLPAANALLKVDSTLRGFVGAMVQAAWEATRCRWVLVCPAVPAQGRIVRDGQLFVRGQPLVKTPFTAEPPAPSATSSVAERLRTTGFTASSLRLLPLPILRDAQRLTAALATAVQDSVCVVADAETDEDLRRLVRCALTQPVPPLWVGAMGLAQALAETTLDSGVAPRQAAPAQLVRSTQRWLIVVGSGQPVARQQWAMLVRNGVMALAHRWDALPPLPADAEVAAVRLDGLSDALRHLPVGTVRRKLRGAWRRWFCEPPFDGIVLVGGMTARAVLEAIGVRHWRIVGAMEQGVPIGVAQTASGKTLKIVTKAGGFGDEQTLWRVVTAIARQPRPARPATG
ncbi:hypothetical protein HRbin17_02670 [bacterium HR17]|uniref:Four-carbon acid sugar kinase family protein n=1 Tax=Candidatus Fervidibacter japonicus TaxID=2035412 RepID=A0A2H5XG14_9BACT|nr:hypothetical protein HRbin17_02670 [bacterium HR17]